MNPDLLERAKEKLANARTPEEVQAAHGLLTSAIRRSRKKAAQAFGNLAETYRLIVQQWDAQKADGVPLEARVAAAESVLRAAWPFTREWKYLCNHCDDTGLMMATCVGDASCGRTKAHLPHEYGRPCWCSLGARFREKRRTEDDAVSAAARVSKPTRFGK